MDVNLIIGIIFLVLIVLLCTEMPVAFALGISGTLGLVLLQGTEYAGKVMGSVPFSDTASFTLTMIPMFILMGVFAVKARVAQHVFAVANRASRRLPGGLAIATVMACAGFAAVSGSSMATSATMSRVSIGEMRKYGYPDHFSAGVVAIAGTLGVMIPPSIFLVLYAVLARESPSELLAAGIIPGLLSALAYIIYIMILGRRQITVPASSTVDSTTRELAGASRIDGCHSNPGGRIEEDNQEGKGGHQTSDRLPWRGVVRVAVLFLIIMGGLYSGIVTATESAALGAIAALVMMFMELRRDGKGAARRSLTSALKDSAETTSMIFLIIVGSGILSTFFVASRVPFKLSEWIGQLDVPPAIIVIAFLIILVPLGMALESISILVIAVPLMHPVVTGLGFEGVWFAILAVKLIEIGLVTPPVGLSCFVVSGTARIPVQKVFRGVFPLLLMDVVVVVLLFMFPSLTLWLPSMVAS